jgi:hypothetical protein
MFKKTWVHSSLEDLSVPDGDSESIDLDHHQFDINSSNPVVSPPSDPSIGHLNPMYTIRVWVL